MLLYKSPKREILPPIGGPTITPALERVGSACTAGKVGSELDGAPYLPERVLLDAISCFTLIKIKEIRGKIEFLLEENQGI